MTTTARLAALRAAWPSMSRDVRADLVRRNVRLYWAMRRLAARDRGAVRS